MRLAVATFLLVIVGGCTDLFGPTDETVATRCGVTKIQLQQTKNQVKKLEPYDGRELGRCTVMKGDGSSDVMVIENMAQVTRQ